MNSTPSRGSRPDGSFGTPSQPEGVRSTRIFKQQRTKNASPEQRLEGRKSAYSNLVKHLDRGQMSCTACQKLCDTRLSEGSRSEGPLLLKCGGCHTTWYCSKECQRNDWPSHKKVCQEQYAAIHVSQVQKRVEKLMSILINFTQEVCPTSGKLFFIVVEDSRRFLKEFLSAGLPGSEEWMLFKQISYEDIDKLELNPPPPKELFCTDLVNTLLLVKLDNETYNQSVIAVAHKPVPIGSVLYVTPSGAPSPSLAAESDKN